MALKSVLTNEIVQLHRTRTLALFTTFGGNTQFCARRSVTKRPPIFFWDQEIKGHQEDMLGSDQLKKLASKVFTDDNLQQMPLTPGKKYTVSIEGNIGCGKTTLLEYFKSSKVVEAIKEPVSQWTNVKGHNALQLLYEDPSRWSFSFNIYAQLTRVQMHTRPHNKPVKMLERSLFSTRHCFVENDYRNEVINGLEYAILKEWFSYLTNLSGTGLDLIVYLRADPTKCYERIKKRSRKEEACVPYKLIDDLHNLHEEWLVKQTCGKLPSPVLLFMITLNSRLDKVLDANHEYQKMTEIYEEKRQEILCGLS